MHACSSSMPFPYILPVPNSAVGCERRHDGSTADRQQLCVRLGGGDPGAAKTGHGVQGALPGRLLTHVIFLFLFRGRGWHMELLVTAVAFGFSCCRWQLLLLSALWDVVHMVVVHFCH